MMHYNTGNPKQEPELVTVFCYHCHDYSRFYMDEKAETEQ